MMATSLGMALGRLMSGWVYDISRSCALAFIDRIIWSGLNIAIMIWLLTRSRPGKTPPLGAVA